MRTFLEGACCVGIHPPHLPGSGTPRAGLTCSSPSPLIASQFPPSRRLLYSRRSVHNCPNAHIAWLLTMRSRGHRVHQRAASQVALAWGICPHRTLIRQPKSPTGSRVSGGAMRSLWGMGPMTSRSRLPGGAEYVRIPANKRKCLNKLPDLLLYGASCYF